MLYTTFDDESETSRPCFIKGMVTLDKRVAERYSLAEFAMLLLSTDVCEIHLVECGTKSP